MIGQPESAFHTCERSVTTVTADAEAKPGTCGDRWGVNVCILEPGHIQHQQHESADKVRW